MCDVIVNHSNNQTKIVRFTILANPRQTVFGGALRNAFRTCLAKFDILRDLLLKGKKEEKKKKKSHPYFFAHVSMCLRLYKPSRPMTI